jgi:thiol-disulfide isomerase/thioredoxin
VASGADRGPRWPTRLGLALARPHQALALADQPAHAGRAGTDLIFLLLAAILAGQLRAVVASGWLAGAIDAGIGLRKLVDLVARQATLPLAFLVLAGAAVWGLAGRRRALGRDLDLACVAVVPLVFVELAATLGVRAVGFDLPPAASWGVAGAGFAWSGGLVALAVAQARRRGAAATPMPAPDRVIGRRAGAGLVALLVATLAVNGAWVIRHLDWLRPVTAGERMPPFSLPRIEAGGALGAPVHGADLAGTVIVLDFWATWCRPCLTGLPVLADLARRGAGRLVVVSVNLDDPGKARALFDAGGYPMTLVADAGGAADRYGVSALPHLVVIDRAGVVRMVGRGEAALAEVVARALELAD